MFLRLLVFLVRQLPPLPLLHTVGQCLLIHEVSRSHTHNDAPQSVRLLWTSDQLVVETCS